MVATNNWAIFAEKNKSEWFYGNLSEEFIENTVSFLNGLDSIGKELFGSGVASIELDWRNFMGFSYNCNKRPYFECMGHFYKIYN